MTTLQPEKLHDTKTRDEAFSELGQWVIDTCLIFGCRPELAWRVASTFIEGLRKELDKKI